MQDALKRKVAENNEKKRLARKAAGALSKVRNAFPSQVRIDEVRT